MAPSKPLTATPFTDLPSGPLAEERQESLRGLGATHGQALVQHEEGHPGDPDLPAAVEVLVDVLGAGARRQRRTSRSTIETGFVENGDDDLEVALRHLEVAVQEVTTDDLMAAMVLRRRPR